MNDADTLVKLMLDHGADFDAIPDAIVPTVRRLLFAAMAAARAEQAERDAVLCDAAAARWRKSLKDAGKEGRDLSGPLNSALEAGTLADVIRAAAASPKTPPAAE